MAILDEFSTLVPSGRGGNGGPGRPDGPDGRPGSRPERDRNDRSHSESWNKSRGHKAWGKGKHGAKDC